MQFFLLKSNPPFLIIEKFGYRSLTKCQPSQPCISSCNRCDDHNFMGFQCSDFIAELVSKPWKERVFGTQACFLENWVIFRELTYAKVTRVHG